MQVSELSPTSDLTPSNIRSRNWSRSFSFSEAFFISPIRAACQPISFILLDLITLMLYIRWRAPHYGVSSTVLLLHPPWASCSVTPSVCCILPLLWEMKFHTHTEHLVKLHFSVYLCLVSDRKTKYSDLNGDKHLVNLICH
jgi:hypothetical protein